MIAKLVVRAETRTEAIRGLRATCERVRCWPVKTNAAFLALVLGDEGFEQGHVDTGMLARQMDDFVPDETPSGEVLQAVAMMVVDATLGGSADDIRQTYIGRPPSAWSWLRGFRANAPFVPTKVHLTDGRDRFEVQFDEPSVSTLPWVEKVAQGYLVDQDGLSFVLREARFEPSSVGALSDGALVAPMPGKVTSVEVAAGEQVTKGQRLLTLEAMKMEHAMLAPFDGVVAELNVAAGAQVQVEAVLARVEAGAGGR
jgi:3-methylcrotonyl-CoA carboxylase alpha subunit